MPPLFDDEQCNNTQKCHKEIMSLCHLFLMMNNATTLKSAIRRLCHYAASFWWWTMQQHSSIYYRPPNKNALCHRKARSKHKTQDNIWKTKESAPIENGTNKSSRKNTRTWRCGYTFVDKKNSVNAWNLEVPLGTSYLVFSSPTVK